LQLKKIVLKIFLINSRTHKICKQKQKIVWNLFVSNKNQWHLLSRNE